MRASACFCLPRASFARARLRTDAWIFLRREMMGLKETRRKKRSGSLAHFRDGIPRGLFRLASEPSRARASRSLRERGGHLCCPGEVTTRLASAWPRLCGVSFRYFRGVLSRGISGSSSPIDTHDRWCLVWETHALDMRPLFVRVGKCIPISESRERAPRPPNSEEKPVSKKLDGVRDAAGALELALGARLKPTAVYISVEF